MSLLNFEPLERLGTDEGREIRSSTERIPQGHVLRFSLLLGPEQEVEDFNGALVSPHAEPSAGGEPDERTGQHESTSKV